MEKTINVVAAAFVKNGKIFAVRRSYGSDYVIHKFEFAGGKREEGESDGQALVRECLEELHLSIEVRSLLATASYAYPDKRVNLSVYLCKMLSGYTLVEHEEEKWIPLDGLNPDEWAPADRIFLERLQSAEWKTEDGFAVEAL